LESRFGNVDGTTVVPCIEVTRNDALSISSTRWTGAQSNPEQQSRGYQSCAAAGLATARKINKHLTDIALLIGQFVFQIPPADKRQCSSICSVWMAGTLASPVQQRGQSLQVLLR
jgi:hypothetical protein